MYLPMLGIDLREHFRTLRAETREFGPATQALVIHVLHHGTPARVFSSADLAKRLGCSAMTVTLALNELESADLGEVFRNGRERCIRFAESPRDTWSKALPLLRSPVTKRLYVEALHGEAPGICAGVSALAQCTMLAQPDHPILAFSKDEWTALRKAQHIIELPAPEPNALEFEVWSYAPSLFAKDGMVDRLSLYLSLKEIQDERVEAALEEMMKGFPW